MGRGLVQCFDAMNVFHISLHKRAPRIQIVLGKLLFCERFVEVVANSILYRRGEQLYKRFNVAVAKRFVSGGNCRAKIATSGLESKMPGLRYGLIATFKQPSRRDPKTSYASTI